MAFELGLNLEEHAGRTLSGVYARVAARLLAMAAAIWRNWKTDTPVKRSLIAYDHRAQMDSLISGIELVHNRPTPIELPGT